MHSLFFRTSYQIQPFSCPSHISDLDPLPPILIFKLALKPYIKRIHDVTDYQMIINSSYQYSSIHNNYDSGTESEFTS